MRKVSLAPGTLPGTAVFKTAAFDRAAIPPAASSLEHGLAVVSFDCSPRAELGPTPLAGASAFRFVDSHTPPPGLPDPWRGDHIPHRHALQQMLERVEGGAVANDEQRRVAVRRRGLVEQCRHACGDLLVALAVRKGNRHLLGAPLLDLGRRVAREAAVVAPAANVS